MKKYVYFLLSGLILIIIGFWLLVSIVRSQESGIVTGRPSQESVSAQSVSSDKSKYIQGMPTELYIPSIGLNLDVTPGVYDSATGKWTLTSDKAQYAVMTPPPNNKEGSTFIYGHYRANVFEKLHTIEPNSVAVIKTDTGHTFYYKLASSRIVSPSESGEVLDYKGNPVLTLQTCTGMFFQNRQLFTFDLKRAV